MIKENFTSVSYIGEKIEIERKGILRFLDWIIGKKKIDNLHPYAGYYIAILKNQPWVSQDGMIWSQISPIKG